MGGSMLSPFFAKDPPITEPQSPLFSERFLKTSESQKRGSIETESANSTHKKLNHSNQTTHTPIQLDFHPNSNLQIKSKHVNDYNSLSHTKATERNPLISFEPSHISNRLGCSRTNEKADKGGRSSKPIKNVKISPNIIPTQSTDIDLLEKPQKKRRQSIRLLDTQDILVTFDEIHSSSMNAPELQSSNAPLKRRKTYQLYPKQAKATKTSEGNSGLYTSTSICERATSNENFEVDMDELRTNFKNPGNSTEKLFLAKKWLQEGKNAQKLGDIELAIHLHKKGVYIFFSLYFYSYSFINIISPLFPWFLHLATLDQNKAIDLFIIILNIIFSIGFVIPSFAHFTRKH